MEAAEVRYGGFWLRMWAFVLDSVCLTILLIPAVLLIYGFAYFSSSGGWFRGPADIFLQVVLPFLLVFWFWRKWLATPGKMLLNCKIVNADGHGAPTGTQLAVRYLGYFLSLVPLGLGFLWIAFDRRKQGWHDKLARTVVIVAGEPRDARRTGRIVAALSAAGVLLFIALGVAAAAWLISNREALFRDWRLAGAAREQGMLWGFGRNASACTDEALARLDACRGFLCGYRSSVFLAGCLPVSESLESYCREVPVGSLLSFQWQRERCREAERDGFGCLQVMSVAMAVCRRYAEQAPDTAEGGGFVR